MRCWHFNGIGRAFVSNGCACSDLKFIMRDYMCLLWTMYER